MNDKGRVKLSMKADLEQLRDGVSTQIRANKYAFKRLAEEQTVLKRKRAAYDKLIRDILSL